MQAKQQSGAIPDRDTVIAMAREAGTPYVNRHAQGETHFGFNEESLLRFAALVAAQEREQCARLVDDIEAKCVADDVDSPELPDVASAIRARKEET